MKIALDHSRETPLYKQLEQALRHRIESGLLEPGSRLPASRPLSVELGVSRITVESAYSSMEADGLIERRAGSGSFVARRQAVGRVLLSAEELPSWQRALLVGADRPGIEIGLGIGGGGDEATVDLATGVGDASLFPLADFKAAMASALSREGSKALGYADPRGVQAFRTLVARVLSSRGVDATPEEILVTSGSQEALGLAALMLRGRGREAIVESPCYASALGLFRSLGYAPRGISMDSGGMRLEPLRAALRDGRAAFIYAMPNFQNPSGARMDAERRRAVVELAGRYDTPIIEDDFVGDLRYEGRDLPSLYTLGGSGVMHSATFSKLLAPGLRVGFIAAKGPAYERLLELKYCLSMSAPRLSQEALARILSVGRYEAHIRRSRRRYAERRDAMLGAIADCLPGFEAKKPSGGLFAWLRLPAGLDSSALADAARRRGVLVFDGRPCFADPGDPDAGSFLRLNFAAESPERIVRGVGALSKAAASLGYGRP
ncbi:MAG: PLP-dependent aminotransferase family protein [Spirochaetes bacterium]|nr:PLP-dependent aminotransferase family protein [Spirochaetota bacterium]